MLDDATSNTSNVTGLSIGANVLEWTIANGPCGTSSDQVLIMVYDQNQPAANAGDDQQFCSPNNSASLQGSPVAFPATGAWSVISGSATISDPASANATVSDLPVGTTVLEWTVNNGPCENGLTTDQVSITIYDGNVQVAAAGPDQAFCTPIVSEITMLASAATAPSTGTWTVLNGSGTISSDTDPFAIVNGAGLGANTFLWTVDNGACGTTSDEVTIAIYDHEAAAADAGPGKNFCQDETSTTLQAVPAQSTSTGIWSLMSGSANIIDPGDPSTEITGLGVGANILTWTIYNGPFEPGDPCGPTSDTILVKLRDCLTLTIPDAFSPNGDGVNDVFQIINIGSYPKNSLQVFNRWGNKVLDRKPYLNDWDGTSQFGAAFGEKLPESTYYYVLDIGDGSEAYTGFIFLRR